MLQLDPLNWQHPCPIQPLICVRNDVDPLKLQCPYYVGLKFNVRGSIFIKWASMDSASNAFILYEWHWFVIFVIMVNKMW